MTMRPVPKCYLVQFLFQPAPIAIMVYLRVGFGLLMAIDLLFLSDWLDEFFVRSGFHFSYWGFDWVKPLSLKGMHLLRLVAGVLALCIATGFFYRFSIIIFTFLFSYLFLTDSAYYLNHFYFIILLSLVLCFCSPHLMFSFDTWGRADKQRNFLPRWQPLLICFTIGVVYFYGGIAKLNYDWLVGNPLYFWLGYRNKFLQLHWLALFMSYAGLIFDLCIIFLLWHKKTRLLGIGLALFFHLTNVYLFGLYIFPWLSLALIFMFCDWHWPEKLLKRLKINWPEVNMAWQPPAKKVRLIINSLIIGFVSYNLLMPLRHFFYPGTVAYTENGRYFSWHMKLRQTNGPPATFTIKSAEPDNTFRVHAREYLSPAQSRMLIADPARAIQFAKYLKKLYQARGHKNVAVYGHIKRSINFRPERLLFNTNLDLASVDDCFSCELPLRPAEYEHSFAASWALVRGR